MQPYRSYRGTRRGSRKQIADNVLLEKTIHITSGKKIMVRVFYNRNVMGVRKFRKGGCKRFKILRNPTTSKSAINCVATLSGFHGKTSNEIVSRGRGNICASLILSFCITFAFPITPFTRWSVRQLISLLTAYVINRAKVLSFEEEMSQDPPLPIRRAVTHLQE